MDRVMPSDKFRKLARILYEGGSEEQIARTLERVDLDARIDQYCYPMTLGELRDMRNRVRAMEGRTTPQAQTAGGPGQHPTEPEAKKKVGES